MYIFLCLRSVMRSANGSVTLSVSVSNYNVYALHCRASISDDQFATNYTAPLVHYSLTTVNDNFQKGSSPIGDTTKCA